MRKTVRPLPRLLFWAFWVPAFILRPARSRGLGRVAEGLHEGSARGPRLERCRNGHRASVSPTGRRVVREPRSLTAWVPSPDGDAGLRGALAEAMRVGWRRQDRDRRVTRGPGSVRRESLVTAFRNSL